MTSARGAGPADDLVRCGYHAAGVCRSCTAITVPYDLQVAAKLARTRELVDPEGAVRWLPPVTSRTSGFRNKAKMVVGGTVGHPTLGILDAAHDGVDLRDCLLYTPGIHGALPALAAHVAAARLTPYDVSTRRGELKHLLVTESPDGELMVRYVLRSTEPLARIRKHLPDLLATLPALAVVSANVLPEHVALLEGEREIPLTERETLRMHVDGIDLHLRPQSFFQTNTYVAAGLYRQARQWLADPDPARVWDLYCGVGGFALQLAAPGREVVGVETSAQAIESARLSAAEAGLDGATAGLAERTVTDGTGAGGTGAGGTGASGRVRFEVGDATAFAVDAARTPDAVVVNPPRRGIGTTLADLLERSEVRHVVYSSCNPVSLAADLARMPSLRLRQARLFDMFPHTEHCEVMVLLERDA